ncbi:restriction endonuclease subunit S [Bacillus sp. UMB0893]|uniref:restriction endonuclease subunit S n=1 Tax=Bacillus sp. UMB0893 TaxID=2066053 RepID=UPI000C789C06|nr:restriction endonuclease subunit S [Bacillus sp. UMB0893]PLR65562.1 restriction endonuclease subunit S [Bacillus sp. UMB0893]
MNTPSLRFKDDDRKDFPAWHNKSIGDIFEERSERNRPDLPLLAVTINKGVTNRKNLQLKDSSSENKDNYKIVHQNDIAYNSMRMWQGASGHSTDYGIVSPAYTVLKPKEGVYSLFFAYLFKTIPMIQKFQRFSQGLTSDTWNLKYPLLSKIKVKAPTYKEQQKIANFLLLLDRRINQQKSKIEALKVYQKGLIQKIFNQEIQFKNNNGEEFPPWLTKSIGDIFEERSERNRPDLPLLAVTINGGVTNRENLSLKDNSSENKDNYKIVHQNDIAYNSMRMWQGACGHSNYHGIVSPAYTVMKPKEGVYSLYFSYLFKTVPMIQMFQRFSQGLTSDTWNLKYPLLSKLKVKVPSYKEQQRIADFLTQNDKKIKLEEEKLQILIKQKKAFMQRMF